MEIKLTEYSRGAGCGCKIDPAVLSEILKTTLPQHDEHLLVGNSSNDDAAAYNMGNGMALVATTDFFTPIVDDAFDFGRIAAANAISDVYAMGAKPILAIAILGWPVDKLPAALAQRVLEGARTICSEAGIPLAGGHSIDASEPVFGLSVNGWCAIPELKRNNTAQAGDVLFLTKPLGSGILSTAQKRKVQKPEHNEVLLRYLTQLNKIGEALGKLPGVTAMTDVTGFGLAGHLIELAEGSGLSAELNYGAIQTMEGAREYLSQRIVPDATYRNWNGYNKKIHFETGVDVMEAFSLLPDPQTNGGILVAARPEAVAEVQELFRTYGYLECVQPIGRLVPQGEKIINVHP